MQPVFMLNIFILYYILICQPLWPEQEYQFSTVQLKDIWLLNKRNFCVLNFKLSPNYNEKIELIHGVIHNL